MNSIKFFLKKNRKTIKFSKETSHRNRRYIEVFVCRVFNPNTSLIPRERGLFDERCGNIYSPGDIHDFTNIISCIWVRMQYPDFNLQPTFIEQQSAYIVSSTFNPIFLAIGGPAPSPQVCNHTIIVSCPSQVQWT